MAKSSQPERTTEAQPRVPEGFAPVELRIAVSVAKAGEVESCCNYDITGRTGNLLLVLPPMTHIQDMPR